MANMELAIIAHRQRSYLMRDLIVAALMVLFVVFQVSAFATSSGDQAATSALPAFTPEGASGASAEAQAAERSAVITADECGDPSVC